MALTPGELAQELRWSVVALAFAFAAYLAVDARRKARAARLTTTTPREEPS
jgi:hypothetical protein